MMWRCGLARKLWLQSRQVLTIPIKSSKLCLLWARVAILERIGDEVFKMGQNNGKSPDNDNTQSQAHSTKNQGSRQFEEKIPKEIRVWDGQGGLACCDSWGRKESDMTERLN